MKHFLLSALAIASAFSASATAKWTLQNREYNVDTVFHAKIGPGTTQTSLELTGAQRLNIFYTTTDLTDPYVDIRVAQAGSRLTGGAKLSTMSNAYTNTSAGVEYFAGVNADFFGNSQPIGSTVVTGSVYKAVASDWISFYMTDKKVPGIELLSFKGTCTGPTSSHAVSSINNPRYENNLVIYNNHYAATTGTNQWGTEVKIVPVEGSLGFNGTLKCRVEGTPVYGAGSAAIPSDAYILSGNGTASAFVQTLKDGDIITFDLTATPATGGIITEMAGGQPIILKNGETLNTQNALDHLTSLNPRTAVGYNADRTKLVLLVVDGRGTSVGVVSKVLADIMREVGCTDAMNFDGGGSSELYTRAFGVRNRPSDGTERTVVNSVWAVANAPVDDTIGEIAFTAPEITLPKYGYYVPVFYGYNKYGVLKTTDLKGVTLSCPPELGEIINDGSTLFANGSGTHTLTATFENGVKSEIRVTIGTAQPHMRLDSVLIDPHNPYTAEVVALVDGNQMSIDNKAMTWTTDDPNIAAVDDHGVISGIAAGKTTIRATVDNFSGSLPVTVQVPGSRYVSIVPDPVPAEWTISKTALREASLSLLDGVKDGLAATYTVSSTRGTKLTLKNVTPLCGVPDSIRLVINPRDANITKIDFSFGPKGERPVTYSCAQALPQNTESTILVPVSEFCDAADFKSYPLEMTSIAFFIGDASGSTHTVEIHGLQTVHTGYADSSSVVDILTPGDNIDSTKAISLNRGDVLSLPEGTTAWTLYSLNGSVITAGKTSAVDTAVLVPGHYILVADNTVTRLSIR